MSAYVFVFGTLKEGFPNFTTNTGQRVLGRFVTEERYPFYLVGERHSPWLMNAPGQGEQVVGQVFAVDAATLERMDILERIHQPDGYQRVCISVVPQSDDTTQHMAVYAYLKPPGSLNAADIKIGPLAEYTLDHAALYRKRGA